MTTATRLPQEVRDRLAEYLVLSRYDFNRSARYGDMAATRRQRELFRIGDKLIDDGASAEVLLISQHVGTRANLTTDEIHAAFRRAALPRIRRVEAETFRHGTRYTRATLAAWKATARSFDLHDWPIR
jgi:hypothetical protein